MKVERIIAFIFRVVLEIIAQYYRDYLPETTEFYVQITVFLQRGD